MSEVCVITGGGSGMGFAAAKFMPKDKIIILSGRTREKLESAAEVLRELGYETYVHTCDTSSRDSVRELVVFASEKGNIRNVVHAAGMSPNMADPEKLLRVNALGTVYVNQEFSSVMKNNSAIIDISSNSAYVLPKFLIRSKVYGLAEREEEKFLDKCIRMSHMAKGDYKRSGFAYALSKNFVVWYAKKCAFSYGKNGIRVCSLSPGLVSTDMGNLEKKEGGFLLKYAAEKRMGTPEELGFAIAMAVDERNGYLTGVDILVDGGSTNGKLFKKRENKSK